ncbi:Prefoldin subunit 6 [Neonectria magnoliae]|uniref:Prefoldin subunit 6 n=1 Tax=Neonectria magnoliae TaxID=2732573 RepID=A0ABR1IF31_9HYPO
MADAQARLQALSEDFQKLQQGMSQHHREDAAINLVAQSCKPQLIRVKNSREFDRLGEGETIYKVAGPVLLKQDKFEAEGTVKGRLDFISSEISRLEGQIKETQEKLERKKMEIMQVQASAQAAAGKGKESAN